MSLVEKVESFNARLERIEAALFGDGEDVPSLPPSKQDQKFVVCTRHTLTGMVKFYAGTKADGNPVWSQDNCETFPDELSALKIAQKYATKQPRGGYAAPSVEKAK